MAAFALPRDSAREKHTAGGDTKTGGVERHKWFSAGISMEVFRQYYSQRIPADAERHDPSNRKEAALPCPAVRFKLAGGRVVVAPICADGESCRDPSAK
jgi:hypothetical protein